MALQRLQDTDLLYDILERQQRIAEERFGDTDPSDGDSTESSAARTTEPVPDSTTTSDARPSSGS